MKTKQLLLCLLSICLLLSGCGVASQNPAQDATNAETDTTGTEMDDNLTSDSGGGNIYSLTDFYMFANTGSRKLEDYVATKRIAHVPNVESKALLRFENIFSNKDLVESIEKIHIPRENLYYYGFTKGRGYVSIEYKAERKTNDWVEEAKLYCTIVDKIEAIQSDTAVDSDIYITEIDGIKVGLRADKYAYWISMGYDGYFISVYLNKSVLNAEVQDAKYAEITALFENGISTEAIQKLIQSIENAIPKDQSESRQ